MFLTASKRHADSRYSSSPPPIVDAPPMSRSPAGAPLDIIQKQIAYFGLQIARELRRNPLKSWNPRPETERGVRFPIASPATRAVGAEPREKGHKLAPNPLITLSRVHP